MKILHIISGGDIGGAKRSVLTLLKELNNLKNVDACLLCIMEGEFTQDAKKMGIPIKIIYQKKRADLMVVKKIADYIESENFDIAHCHGARANYIAFFLRKLINIPMLTTVHSDYKLDFENSPYKKMAYTPINALALRQFGCLMTVSRELKETLVKRGFKNEKIGVAYNGIDFDEKIKITESAVFLNQYGIKYDKNNVYVGIAARMHPVKDVATFIKAAELAASKNEKLCFLLAGSGEEYDKHKKYIIEHKLNTRIHMLGHVLNMESFYNCIDINALTSVSEGLPYAVLEGARMKKATVSSKLPSVMEIIEDGKTGLFFDVGDYKTLADIILRLADDPKLRVSLGNEFYNSSCKKFSSKNMALSYFNVYNKILNKNSLQILIAGYHGYGNCGDEATLLAMKNNIRAIAPQANITALSYKPKETEKQYGIEAVKRFNILKVIKALKKCDILLSGGGSLLQDETSTRSLMYYLSIILAAKLLRKKVMLYGNGIGPIKKESNRRRIKFVVDKVDIITLREELSNKELKSIGVTKPAVHVTADPAFTLKGAPDKKVRRLLASEKTPVPLDKPLLGVAIRDWTSSVGDFVQSVAEVCDYMNTEMGYNILLIPMQYPSDLAITKRLKSTMKTESYILLKKYKVEDTLGIISKVDIMLSMRLHTLIFAGVQKVPMLGIVYDPKIEHYLKLLNMPQVGDVRIEKLDVNCMKAAITEMAENRHVYKQTLSKISEELESKANMNSKYLLEIINTIQKNKRSKGER